MYLEIGFMLIGAVLFILVLFTIPILIKVWRVVNQVTVTLEALNERLPGILRNMEETSANINQSTASINYEVQKYTATAERLHHVVSSVVRGMEWLSPLSVRSPFLRKVSGVAAVVKGVRTFIQVLADKKIK